MPCVQGHVSAGVFRFYLYNQNFLPIKKFTLRTCKNMTKTIVFTLQEQDVTTKKPAET